MEVGDAVLHFSAAPFFMPSTPGNASAPFSVYQVITSTSRRPAWTAGSASARRRASSTEPTR